MLRQARSEARKQAKIKRHEKAVELQMALEDRAAARRVEQELAEMHRTSMPYSAAIHRPPDGGDARNFHPHILLSLRPMQRVEAYCWDIADEVCGELDGRDGVQMLRHLWSYAMTEAAQAAGSNRRYTGLGYGARGLDLEAGEHLGEARAAIVARGGRVWAHERNRIRNGRNALRRAMRDADHKIAALSKVREAALERIEREGTLRRPGRIVRAAPVVVPARLRTSATGLEPANAVKQRLAEPSQSRTKSGTVSRPTGPLTPSLAVRGSGPARQASVPPQDKKTRAATPQPSPATARLAVAADIHPPARLTAAPTLAAHQTRQTSQPARLAAPPIEVTVAQTAPSIEHDILHHLALARTRRERERAAKRRRDRQMALSDMPLLGERPRLDLLEAFPAVPAAAIPGTAAALDQARIAHLTKIDAYVADYGGEALDVSSAALKAVGVDDAWLSRPWVQHGLAAIRAEQQVALATMVADADTRPLAFAKARTRFWPRDLDPDLLRRFDRWAADPGFQGDVFAVERRIYAAHQVHDAIRRAEVATARSNDPPVPNTLAAGLPHADGFGGSMDTPPPVFVHRTVSPRIEPFDAATGAPHRSLLRLLHHCGTQPGTLVFAEDGKLMLQPASGKGVEPLIHLWRDDPRVEALVIETVTVSRAAG